jgi:diguanylate cyclase (GGDEF)-like protein
MKPASPATTEQRPPSARLRALFASPAPAYTSELDTFATDEARKGSHLVLPFQLPTIYFVGVILGDAVAQPGVRLLLGVQVAAVVLRWCVLVAMSRVALSGVAERTRARLRSGAFTASAWLVSASFAATYLAASPAVDFSVTMRLAMIATAVCAVAMLNMSAMLWSYFGFIAIHLGAIVVLMLRHPDPLLGSTGPLMVIVLAALLAIVAARTNGAVRGKILLGLQLRDSALRDALTGLRNRHFVTQFLGHASAQVLGDWQAAAGRRPVTQKRSLALFLVDLDHFKLINDTYGHAAGDRVLVAFAEVAQSTLRAPDIVARWGGEEFLVVVETRDRESALKIGERLRRRLAAHRTVDASGTTLSATCSIGVCLFPFDDQRPDNLTWEETLELADHTLYEAKRTGRNRALWVRPGTARLLPREALMATRETLGGAARDHAVEIVAPTHGMDGRPSGNGIAVAGLVN